MTRASNATSSGWRCWSGAGCERLPETCRAGDLAAEAFASSRLADALLEAHFAAPASSAHELDEAERKAIELAYFGGLTHSEIAEALGMPLGTVKGRMRLAMEKIRATLAEGV